MILIRAVLGDDCYPEFILIEDYSEALYFETLNGVVVNCNLHVAIIGDFYIKRN